MVRGDIRDVGENDWPLGDCTVGRSHKRWDPAQRIDGKVRRVGLPAPFDSHDFIAETGMCAPRAHDPAR
jgi:hypothetical protein